MALARAASSAIPAFQRAGRSRIFLPAKNASNAVGLASARQEPPSLHRLYFQASPYATDSKDKSNKDAKAAHKDGTDKALGKNTDKNTEDSSSSSASSSDSGAGSDDEASSEEVASEEMEADEAEVVGEEEEVAQLLTGASIDEDIDISELEKVAEAVALEAPRAPSKRMMPSKPVEMLLDQPVCFTCGENHWTFECETRTFDDWPKWRFDHLSPEATDMIISKLREAGAYVEAATPVARVKAPVFENLTTPKESKSGLGKIDFDKLGPKMGSKR